MMSTKKYRIRLTTDEQQELNALVSRGRAAAYKQTHARILLMSDESRSDGGMKDADITSALGVGQSTVERIRKRCVEEGVESALNRKKQLRRRQKRLDGEGEARLIAMTCGSSGPHHQDSGESKIRESTAGGSRKPSSDGKACGCSSKHLCGLTAWNT